MSTTSKKLLSLVIVLALVLAMAPAITLPTVAAASGHPFDTAAADDYIICDHCGPVKKSEWTAISSLDADEFTTGPAANSAGVAMNTGHYYLDKSITCPRRYVLDTVADSTVCVHLNGYTLATTGSSSAAYLILNKGTLNVMGEGTMTRSYDNTNIYGCVSNATGSTNAVLNLYGGTYDNVKANTGVSLGADAGTINIFPGVTVNDQMHFRDNAVVNIYGGTFNNIWTRGTGTSRATVNIYGGNFNPYSGRFPWYGTESQCPNFNIYGGKYYCAKAAESDMIATISPYMETGCTTLNPLNKYVEVLPAAVTRTPAEQKAAVDAWRTANASKFAGKYGAVAAQCPACNTQVAWMPLANGSVVNATNEDHEHYYIAEDYSFITGGSTTQNTEFFVGQKTRDFISFCVYLNEKTLTTNTMINSGCEVNIIGNGTITTPETTKGPLLYSNGRYGELNIFGGTYIENNSKTQLLRLGQSPSQYNHANELNVFDGTFQSAGAVLDIYETAGATPGYVNIYGGELTGNGYGMLEDGANLNLLGGNMNASLKADDGATVNITLSGNASAKELHMGNAGENEDGNQLVVEEGWTGTAGVRWNKSFNPGEAIPEELLDAPECEGKLLYWTMNKAPLVYEDGAYMLPYIFLIADNGTQSFTTTAEAMTAYAALGENKGYISLYKDSELELNGDAFVDSNGNDITVSGTGKLYAMNASDDNHNGTGKYIVSGVTVAPAAVNPINGKYYLNAVSNNEATSYGLSLRLSKVSLRPGDPGSNMGLYYTAKIFCNEAVASNISGYGVVLSLQDMPGDNFLTEINPVNSKNPNRYTMIEEAPVVVDGVAEVNSGGVFGIMTPDEAAYNTNATNGAMPIYANAYVAVKMDNNGDEVYLMADTVNGGTTNGVKHSLKTVMEALDGIETESVRTAAKTFYGKWAQYGMQAWADSLPNLAA